MKKSLINRRRLIYCIGLTFIVPYFPFVQENTGNTLWLGFPYKFYTVYYTQNGFSIHFGIGTFILDLIVFYVICTLILVLVKKMQNKKGENEIWKKTKRFLVLCCSVLLLDKIVMGMENRIKIVLISRLQLKFSIQIKILLILKFWRQIKIIAKYEIR